MSSQTNQYTATATRWSDLHEDVLMCIMEQVDSYDDLSSFIRVSPATWGSYWSRRRSILLNIVPRVMGHECMREALTVVRVPHLNDSPNAEAWDEQFAKLLTDYASDSVQPQLPRANEVLQLVRLDLRVRPLVADYLSRRRSGDDRTSDPSPPPKASRGYPGNGCLEDEMGVKRTFIHCELYPQAIQKQPGFVLPRFAGEICSIISAFPLWQRGVFIKTLKSRGLALLG